MAVNYCLLMRKKKYVWPKEKKHNLTDWQNITWLAVMGLEDTVREWVPQRWRWGKCLSFSAMSWKRSVVPVSMRRRNPWSKHFIFRDLSAEMDLQCWPTGFGVLLQHTDIRIQRVWSQFLWHTILWTGPLSPSAWWPLPGCLCRQVSLPSSLVPQLQGLLKPQLCFTLRGWVPVASVVSLHSRFTSKPLPAGASSSSLLLVHPRAPSALEMASLFPFWPFCRWEAWWSFPNRPLGIFFYLWLCQADLGLNPDSMPYHLCNWAIP